MSDKTLKDLTVDAHIAVLHTKVDALIEKQKELTERVRANEKVVAALGVLGSIAIAFIGAGAFAPRAEACSPPADGSEFVCPDLNDRIIYHEDKEPNYDYYSTRNEVLRNAGWMIQEMRDWESEQNRTPVDKMLNNALADLEWYEHGSDDPTVEEELLQFPSEPDRQGS